jgi:hypothetical protein
MRRSGCHLVCFNSYETQLAQRSLRPCRAAARAAGSASSRSPIDVRPVLSHALPPLHDCPASRMTMRPEYAAFARALGAMPMAPRLEEHRGHDLYIARPWFRHSLSFRNAGDVQGTNDAGASRIMALPTDSL